MDSAALPVRFNGLNSDLMSQYVEHVADLLLDQLGVPRLYNTPNPVSAAFCSVLEARPTSIIFLVPVYGDASFSREIQLL